MTPSATGALPPGAVRAAKAAAILVVLGFCAWAVAGHWSEARAALATTTLRWPALAASALSVLAAYAVLIQVWRAILAGAGERLPFWPAARIWTVSNLGKYVPGKVWQMSAMAVMARERGVSGVAAAGSAVLSTLVTLATGFAVTLLTGARVLPDRRMAVAAALVAVLAVAATPFLLPVGERILARVLRRDVAFPRLAPSSLFVAVLGTSLGWLLLGMGFHFLARGLGAGDLAPGLSIAVFVGSYLIGFLAVFAPGGIGVRESAMGFALARVGAGAGEVLVLVAASRLWLTLIEIAPALVFLAMGALRGSGPPPAPAVPPTTVPPTRDAPRAP